MSSFAPLPAAVVTIAALIAATTDVWKYKVYNALTLPLLLSGLVYGAAVGGWAGLAGSGVGLLFGFAILLLFYLAGGMGAGDVKLMAGIGAWLGMPLTFYVFIASALAGGLYAVGLLLLSNGLQETLIKMHILWLRLKAFGRHLAPDDRVEVEVKRDDRRQRLIPYAAMVAVGVIATFLCLLNGLMPSR